MTKALDIYQAVILEHNRSPRGMGTLLGTTHQAEGFNPICGDRVTVMLRINSDQIDAVGFVAQCCALCRASCSVLVEAVRSSQVKRANEIASEFEMMLSGGPWQFGGDARAFAAVKDYPARKKCVLLPWKTLQAALSTPRVGNSGFNIPAVVVSTEGEV